MAGGFSSVLAGARAAGWTAWTGASLWGLLGIVWAPASIASHFQHYFLAGWLLLAALLAWRPARALLLRRDAPRRTRMLLLAGATALLLHGAVVAAVWVHAPAPPRAAAAAPAAAPEIDLLWFNMHHTHEAWQALKELVRDDPPDVVGLAEAQLVDPQELPGYPYALRSRRDGNLLLSRLPLDRARLHEIRGRRDLLEADVLLDGARLKLFVAHTFHPGVGGVLREFDSIGAHLRRARGETAALALVGDLNQTPWSALFGGLMRAGGLRHACDLPGPRISWRPLDGVGLGLEIDHLLAAEGVEVLSFEQLPWLPGSDHRPLRARLRVLPEGGEGALQDRR